MYCKKCGKRLADGDKFCGNCGTKIDVSEINIGFAEEEPKPKKNFDFGAFNWDLDGYPDEDKAKTEDVDFNWNTVLEEKKRKDIEEKSFTETIMTENELFDRIQSEDNAKDASEISFNWELGSTTRVEKADRFESIIPKVEEKAELDIPVEVSEDHEEVKDLVDIDEALAAGIAAASSPRKSIDKFYTFNQKNEEFQALLDQEYERLRNRIREDSEAEAIIANKEEKLEQARATWSKEPLEEPVEEAEETVEVTEETEAPVEVAVESEVEATEVEEAEAEAVNDAENTEEAQDTEVETEEAPETEEADVETESEFEEVEETEEATDEDEEAVQEAEEPAIQEEACVVETQAQAEEVEKAEEPEAEDTYDDNEEAEAEETPSKPESGNPPSDEEKKEEDASGDEDSKETKLHYSDIFANDDVHDSDSRNEQKTGRWKIIVLDIIIVILAIAVICSGILVFAKGSAPANKISQGISWVTEKFSGSSDNSKDDKKSEEKAEKTKSMEDVVAAAKKNYVNIGKVQYDSKLKFDTSKDYGLSELKNAKKFKDGEFSGGKLLSEAIVNLSLGYYSGLTDKVNSGSDDVLKLINEDSELYGHVKAIAEGDEEQQIKNIKIGEIKNSGSNYYVILQITEGKANSSDTSTETKILSILNKGKELKVTAATDAE
ncbi:MAG: zinc ribbon domain-containing protein [[Eubacterium] sulci]|nr:zinc ribbon domain-containing protein [[Eubacterium] sulci]MBF1181305.1 zinc ribbon domain-containing protein [[Eubacterium] sulci]